MRDMFSNVISFSYKKLIRKIERQEGKRRLPTLEEAIQHNCIAKGAKFKTRVDGENNKVITPENKEVWIEKVVCDIRGIVQFHMAEADFIDKYNHIKALGRGFLIREVDGGTKLDRSTVDPAKLEKLLAKADDDYESNLILKYVVIELISEGQLIPTSLKRFVAESLLKSNSPRNRSGRNPLWNQVRDSQLAICVFKLLKSGVNPTRNEATTAYSGCDIVVEAFNRVADQLGQKRIKYEVVRKAWDRSNKNGTRAHWEKHSGSVQNSVSFL
jgi:hypothetical protein